MFTSKAKKQAEFIELLKNNKDVIIEILNDEANLNSIYEYFTNRCKIDMVEHIKQLEKNTIDVMMASDTPWFKILDKNAVNLKDKILYNNAFVQELKQLGYSANNEEYIISEFLDILQKDDTENRKKLLREQIQKSDEPWVEVLGNASNNIADRGFVELKLDWNPAFIRYLNDNGINEKTDELCVQKWLSSLNHQTIMNDDGNGFI